MRTLVLAAALVFSACQHDKGPYCPFDKSAVCESQEYLISPRDYVQVTVWEHPEFSAQTEVALDGTIYLPIVGYIPAADRTAMDLKEDLQQRLSEYLERAHVTLVVTQAPDRRSGIFKPRLGDYPIPEHLKP